MSFSSPLVFLSPFHLLFLFCGKQQNNICMQSAGRGVKHGQQPDGFCDNPQSFFFLNFYQMARIFPVSCNNYPKKQMFRHMNTHVHSHLITKQPNGLRERLHCSRSIRCPQCRCLSKQVCVYLWVCAWSREEEQLREWTEQRAHVWLNK